MNSHTWGVTGDAGEINATVSPLWRGLGFAIAGIESPSVDRMELVFPNKDKSTDAASGIGAFCSLWSELLSDEP
jgi:hypothetical protein